MSGVTSSWSPRQQAWQVRVSPPGNRIRSKVGGVYLLAGRARPIRFPFVLFSAGLGDDFGCQETDGFGRASINWNEDRRMSAEIPAHSYRLSLSY